MDKCPKCEQEYDLAFPHDNEVCLTRQLVQSQELAKELEAEQTRAWAAVDGADYRAGHMADNADIDKLRDVVYGLALQKAELEAVNKTNRSTIESFYSSEQVLTIMDRLVAYPIIGKVMETVGAAYDFNEFGKLAMRLETENKELRAAQAAAQEAGREGETDAND